MPSSVVGGTRVVDVARYSLGSWRRSVRADNSTLALEGFTTNVRGGPGDELAEEANSKKETKVESSVLGRFGTGGSNSQRKAFAPPAASPIAQSTCGWR